MNQHPLMNDRRFTSYIHVFKRWSEKPKLERELNTLMTHSPASSVHC